MKVYLDNAATTRPDPLVIEAVSEAMNSDWGNASSVHSAGQRAAGLVEAARDTAAGAIGSRANEIIFTSGATEADNIALLGFARANAKRGRHIITTNVEHHAVLNSLKYLSENGFEVTYLPVDGEGLISAEDAARAIRPDTILISVMHVNNELGTIMPIREIGQLASSRGVAFHVDAAQSMGKLPIDVARDHIDLLSVSAHKFHGPKGIGFLYAKSSVRLEPVMFGGEQETRLRSGTIASELIAGMGRAIELSLEDMEQRETKIRSLRDYFIARVLSEIPSVRLNGSLESRSAENANFWIGGVATDKLLYGMDMEGVCFSAGSACSAGSIEPSYVTAAIGRAVGGASARFSLSKYTSKEELDYTVEALCRVVGRLREKG